MDSGWDESFDPSTQSIPKPVLARVKRTQSILRSISYSLPNPGRGRVNPHRDPPPLPDRAVDRSAHSLERAAAAVYTPVPRSPPHPRSWTARLIRVALLVQPPVLHSLLAGMLADDPDVQVVGQDADGPEDADVVVLSQPDPENEAAPVAMLLRSPRSRVLTLATDARRAVLYELRPHRTPLGELSRQALLAAVHGAPGEAA